MQLRQGTWRADADVAILLGDHRIADVCRRDEFGNLPRRASTTRFHSVLAGLLIALRLIPTFINTLRQVATSCALSVAGGAAVAGEARPGDGHLFIPVDGQFRSDPIVTLAGDPAAV